MTRKDLSAYLTPALELTDESGRTWTVQPPSKDAGLKLAAINAVGTQVYALSLEVCPTCGKPGAPQIPADTLAIIDSIGSADVASLSLGRDVYDAMLAADVPGPHIDLFGLYALYYWTLGEQVADQIMSASHGGAVAGVLSTGSGNRTQRRARQAAKAVV